MRPPQLFLQNQSNFQFGNVTFLSDNIFLDVAQSEARIFKHITSKQLAKY